MPVIRKLLGRALRTYFPRTYRAHLLGEYVTRHLLPDPVHGENAKVPTSTVGCHGIDMRLQEQIERLESWEKGEYPELWESLRRNSRINTWSKEAPQQCSARPVRNGYYHS